MTYYAIARRLVVFYSKHNVKPWLASYQLANLIWEGSHHHPATYKGRIDQAIEGGYWSRLLGILKKIPWRDGVENYPTLGSPYYLLGYYGIVKPLKK